MCCRLLHAELLVNGDYQEFEENGLKTWSHNHTKPLQAQSQVDNAVLMGLLFKTEKLWSAGSYLPFRQIDIIPSLTLCVFFLLLKKYELRGRQQSSSQRTCHWTDETSEPLELASNTDRQRAHK